MAGFRRKYVQELNEKDVDENEVLKRLQREVMGAKSTDELLRIMNKYFTYSVIADTKSKDKK